MDPTTRRRTPEDGTLDPCDSTVGDGGRRTLGVDERRTPGSSVSVVPASGSPLSLVRAPSSAPMLMDDNLPASVVRPGPSSSPDDDDARPAFVIRVQRRRWPAGVIRLQRRRRRQRR